MEQNIPSKLTIRAIINDLLGMAENEEIPTVQEISNIKAIDTLFDYLKKNYDTDQHRLRSIASKEELIHLSRGILGANYDEFAYKLGIKNNGILPIIACLAMYVETGNPFSKD